MNPLTTSTLARSSEKKQSPVKLALIESLLELFHREQVLYCHWKSTEHLGASLSGDTDLDILFNSREELEPVLQQLGFKKFQPVWQKQYSHIDDYIGLDLESGKLVHLHAHFRLTLGEAYLKSYQLPFEEAILYSRSFDAQLGIYCIQPEWEQFLLFVREALKIRTRNRISSFLWNKNAVSQNSVREWSWLRHRCNESILKKIIMQVFPKHPEVYEIVSGNLDRRQLIRLSTILKTLWRKYRSYPALQARLLRWYRELSLKTNRKWQEWLGRPALSRRTNPKGGFVVAVIGADGSGKSTVTRSLEKTFHTKLDLFRIYFGRGDGKISVARKVLFAIKKRFIKKQRSSGTGADSFSPGKKQGLAARLYKSAEALIVASEKSRNLKRMATARKKGMLVICDRFPQNQVMGYNDGPLLHFLSGSRNFLFRWAARRERRLYERAAKNSPDLVIKLIADASVVAARKPGETPVPLLLSKIEGIRNLVFDGCTVKTIDASQPLQKVLFQVRKAIWTAMP